MRRTPNKDLDKLLRAVSDPFQHLDPPFHYGHIADTADDYYDDGAGPVKATVILMEFASVDLWRDHLRYSNFTSCEEIMSTEEGRRPALYCMLRTAETSWPNLLHTPSKITTAIRRLEELQCPNTAEIIIMWAWTIGVINPMDHVAWKFIRDETLRFYQTHGFRRLGTTYHRYDHDKHLQNVPRSTVPDLSVSSGVYSTASCNQQGYVSWGKVGRPLCFSGLSVEEVVLSSWVRSYDLGGDSHG